MPTYEYKCDACGHAFERFQSMTADRIKQCPVCKKNKVRRLIGTGAGLIFKGSGFYITDYRSEGYKEKAKAEAGGGTAAAKESKPAEGAGTAESKPAAPAAKTEVATAATTTPAKPETKPVPAPQAKSSSAKKKSS